MYQLCMNPSNCSELPCFCMMSTCSTRIFVKHRVSCVWRCVVILQTYCHFELTIHLPNWIDIWYCCIDIQCFVLFRHLSRRLLLSSRFLHFYSSTLMVGLYRGGGWLWWCWWGSGFWEVVVWVELSRYPLCRYDVSCSTAYPQNKLQVCK